VTKRGSRIGGRDSSDGRGSECRHSSS
jgi:hypothetical protein